MEFDADEQDALREVVNVAMGQAGASLARTLGTFVRLTIPKLYWLSPDRLAERAVAPDGWADRQVTVVREAFFGVINGESLTLIDLSQGGGNILGDDGQLTTREFALEIGNMLVGACLDGISDQLGFVVGYSPPQLICAGTSAVKALADLRPAAGPELLAVAIDFHVDSSLFNSRVVLVFTTRSADRIHHSVAKLLAALSG
jgi:chemotaxis protein CheC